MATPIEDEFNDEYVTTRERAVDDATVVEIEFTRPKKLNALPAESLATVVEVVDSLTRDRFDAVVFKGAGDHFCAGVDVAELEAQLEGDSEVGDEIHELVETLRSCPLPVVAAVSGIAFGAGFLICMAADVVIADTDAEFGLQEVNLGIPVAGYASTILPHIVGEHRARDWLFTGRVIDVEAADTAGFVTQMVPPAEHAEALEDYIRQLTTGSSQAIATLKERMASPASVSDATEIRAAETEALRTAFSEGNVLERLQSLRDT